MLFREGANPVHMGSAAIGVLPHQLLTLHIAFHDHRPPTKGVKVENAVIPDHGGRGAHAILVVADGEQHRTLGIISIKARRTIGAIVVNNSTGSDYDTATALFHPLHVPHVAALYAQPKAPDIVRATRQGLRALRQYRQWVMCIATSRSVALGDICGHLVAAIEFGQFTVVDSAAITGKRRRVSRERRPGREESQPEQK